MAQKSSSLNRPMTFSASTVVLFAFVFGLVGGYALFKSFAAKPTSGVTLTQVSPGTATSGGTYQVTPTSQKMIKNKYYLWGSETCYDSSNTVMSSQGVGVRWADVSSTSGTLSFGVHPADSSQCHVFVWMFPDAWTPVSNTVVVNS